MSDIKYWRPVQLAWDKMKTILFRPFDLHKWFVMGWCAFLAYFGQQSGANFEYKHPLNEQDKDAIAGVGNYFCELWEAHPSWICTGIILAALLIVVISIVICWLNSRGQFMLLDNVITNRGAVTEPWKTYKKEANSLTCYQVALGFISAAITIPCIIGLIISMLTIYPHENLFSTPFIICLSVLIVVAITSSFIQLLLKHFIVPMMFKYRLSVAEGFKTIYPMLKANFWRIVLFALVLSWVTFLFALGIIAISLLTCCIGIILMAIPYIGSVVLLPLHVTTRLIGLEFMRQFGEEFDLLTEWAPILPSNSIGLEPDDS